MWLKILNTDELKYNAGCVQGYVWRRLGWKPLDGDISFNIFVTRAAPWIFIALIGFHWSERVIGLGLLKYGIQLRYIKKFTRNWVWLHFFDVKFSISSIVIFLSVVNDQKTRLLKIYFLKFQLKRIFLNNVFNHITS
jgi:hypothetical protein